VIYFSKCILYLHKGISVKEMEEKGEQSCKGTLKKNGKKCTYKAELSSRQVAYESQSAPHSEKSTCCAATSIDMSRDGW
jgi:hypothetical protein